MNIEEIERKLAGYFSTRPEIEVGYIFGSKGSGRENKLSDTDIAVLIDETALKENYPYGYKAGILTELSKLLKTDKLDLVVLNNAPCLLRHRVVCRGRVVFSRAESKRIRFQVRTIDEYNDFKRLLALHH